MKNKGFLCGLLIFVVTIMTTAFSASAVSIDENNGLASSNYSPSGSISPIGNIDFPEKYDPRETNDVTPVKNQNPLKTCWAFASIGDMEQVVYNQTGIRSDYSEEAMRYVLSNKLLGVVNNSDIGYYNRSADKGGLFQCAAQYLTSINSPISNKISWLSPNKEKDIPYVNSENPWYDELETSHADAYASGVHYERYDLSGSDIARETNIYNMKKAITNYGGIVVSFNSLYQDYYNKSFYCPITKKTNHEVVCVGWDDNYSRENFDEERRPLHDGAWLIKNSHGVNEGDQGFIWISYDDKSLCNNGNGYYCVIDKVSKTSQNEKMLSYDYTPIFGRDYGKTINKNDTASMANVYDISAFKSEYGYVNKVMFYTSNIGAQYDIYIVPIYGSQTINNIGDYGESLSSGNVNYEGYITANLDRQFDFTNIKCDKIVVIVTFSTDSASPKYMCFNNEINTDIDKTTEERQCTYQSVVHKNESYYKNGSSWVDISGGITDNSKGNFCIRPTLVRRTSITQDSTLSAYTKDYYGENVKININLNGNSLFKVTDENGNLLYQDKDYTLYSGASDGSVLRFSAKSSYLSNLNEGESRTIIFEFTDGSNQALVITHRVNIPAVYITGAASYGQTLEAFLADSYNAGDDVSYQWQRSADGSTWSNIDGATSSTYVINFNDIGKYLRVFVSAKSDGIYFYGQARTSAQKGIVTIVYGDVNMDGEVTLQDIETINSFLNGEIEFTTHQHVLADVNGDGNINNTDILLITKFINNEIDYFPVEN